MKNKRTNNNGGGGRLQVFNLGSGVGYSVLEMVAAMEDACKCKVGRFKEGGWRVCKVSEVCGLQRRSGVVPIRTK